MVALSVIVCYNNFVLSHGHITKYASVARPMLVGATDPAFQAERLYVPQP